MNEERESSMVQDLLDLKDRLDTVIADSFEGSEKFVIALKVGVVVLHWANPD